MSFMGFKLEAGIDFNVWIMNVYGCLPHQRSCGHIGLTLEELHGSAL